MYLFKPNENIIFWRVALLGITPPRDTHADSLILIVCSHKIADHNSWIICDTQASIIRALAGRGVIVSLPLEPSQRKPRLPPPSATPSLAASSAASY